MEDLWVQRGRHTVLQGVRLEAERGEVLVVLGPNGAGKTTLLEAIAGLIEPSRGRILVDGITLYDSGPPRRSLPVEKRRLGYVPQDYALLPHLTVYENIALGLRAQRLSHTEIDQRVRELAGLLGIESLLYRYPHQLSRGQQQRVAIARALAVEPKLLLLDEPFSALDAPSREVLRSELRQILSRARTTTIMVTHSFADAWLLADRLVVLEKGVVKAKGTPYQLATRPLRHGVADFLGYTILEGRVVERRGSSSIVEVNGLGELVVEEELAPGTRVLVALRPDDIVVTRSGHGVNTFKARVVETILTRYGVRLKLETGGFILVAEQARGQLVASLGGIPQPGSTIWIHVPPQLPDIVPIHTGNRHSKH